MKKIFTLILFVIFSDTTPAMLNVYNVGHGACATYKNGHNVLMLDCGSFNERVPQQLLDLLVNDDVININVIISHAHWDHYNFITSIFRDHEDIRNKLQYLYIGIHNIPERLDLDFDYLRDAQINERVIYLSNRLDLVDGGVLDTIRGCLGECVDVSLLLPTTNPLSDPHLENIVTVIDDRRMHYKMLFPGDASYDLLQYIYWANGGENIERLKKINLFVASHHGSTRSNEDRWLSTIVGLGVSYDFLCAISASPLFNNWMIPSGVLYEVFPKNLMQTNEHVSTLLWRGFNNEAGGFNNEAGVFDLPHNVRLFTTHNQGNITIYPQNIMFQNQ